MCRGIHPKPALELSLDINSEIFEVKADEKLRIAIARNLSIDGHGNEHYEQVIGKPSLLDEYDYAMHGIAYKYKQVQSAEAGKHNSQVEVHVSHGGLLARIIGEERQLCNFKVDDQVYTLIRKVEGSY